LVVTGFHVVILVQTIKTADRELEVSFYYKVGIMRHVGFTTFMKKQTQTK